VKITNAELEDVEIVISPDHRVFGHTDPLRGLVEGGTFVLQSSLSPLEVWRSCRSRRAARCAPSASSSSCSTLRRGQAPRADAGARDAHDGHRLHRRGVRPRRSHRGRGLEEALLGKIRQQIAKKFGAKGGAVVEGNLAVMREGLAATQRVDYEAPEFTTLDAQPVARGDVPWRSRRRCAAPAGQRRTPGSSTADTTRR